jgi:hypothetical protein
MNAATRNASFPSPLGGEGAERTRSVREVGEGAFMFAMESRRPLTRLPRFRSEVDLSPQAGRGEERPEIAR